MELLRTILVPIDFSRASIAAFEAALLLRREDTALFVVHVLDQAWIDFTVELGYGMPGEIAAKARMHAESHMRRLTGSATNNIERVVTIGRPAEKILDLAKELEADLIVMGRPPAERSPGTFAERILRFAACPVLAIPGEGGIAEVRDATPENEPAGAPASS